MPSRGKRPRERSETWAPVPALALTHPLTLRGAFNLTETQFPLCKRTPMSTHGRSKPLLILTCSELRVVAGVLSQSSTREPGAPRLGPWNGRPKTARTNENCKKKKKKDVNLEVWFGLRSSTCKKHKNGHEKRCFKLEVTPARFLFSVVLREFHSPSGLGYLTCRL